MKIEILAIGEVRLIGENDSDDAVLKNFDGSIVDDGDYDIELKLYTETTGGTEIWTEPQTITTVGGVFNSYLGATPGGLADLQILPFDVSYYVGVSIVGSPEMAPRIELTGMPYAIRATTANYANGMVLPATLL